MKYRAKKTVVDDITFASKLESQRYMYLKYFKEEKKIKDFQLQVPMVIELNNKKIAKYVCDFCVTTNNGEKIYEDVKGFKTQVYRLKKKLVEAQYCLQVLEITKDNIGYSYD